MFNHAEFVWRSYYQTSYHFNYAYWQRTKMIVTLTRFLLSIQRCSKKTLTHKPVFDCLGDANTWIWEDNYSWMNSHLSFLFSLTFYSAHINLFFTRFVYIYIFSGVLFSQLLIWRHKCQWTTKCTAMTQLGCFLANQTNDWRHMLQTNLKEHLQHTFKKHLFEVKEAYKVYISKKWTFLKTSFYGKSQLSCFHPLASLEKTHFFNNHICISHSKTVEPSLFGVL